MLLGLQSLPVVYIVLKIGRGILQAPAERDKNLSRPTVQMKDEAGREWREMERILDISPVFLSNAQCICYFFTLTFACLLSLLVPTFAFPCVYPTSPTSPSPLREKQTSTSTAWPPSIKAKSCRWVINYLLHLSHIAGGPSFCPMWRNTTLLWLEEQGFTAHSLWPVSIPLQTARRTYLNINHQT